MRLQTNWLSNPYPEVDLETLHIEWICRVQVKQICILVEAISWYDNDKSNAKFCAFIFFIFMTVDSTSHTLQTM